VDALAAGADDVVEERVDRNELVARMHAIVRRSRGHSQSTLRVGPLSLDLERHEAWADGTPVALTGKEFQLLHLLMLRKNMVMTKDVILEQLYGGIDEPETKIIDVFVCKIRKKLARAGVQDVLGTVWGRGYTIRDSRPDSDARVLPHAPEPVYHARPSLAFA
jgi:two-component system cell cycle response regulator CtrA